MWFFFSLLIWWLTLTYFWLLNQLWICRINLICLWCIISFIHFWIWFPNILSENLFVVFHFELYWFVTWEGDLQNLRFLVYCFYGQACDRSKPKRASQSRLKAKRVLSCAGLGVRSPSSGSLGCWVGPRPTGERLFSRVCQSLASCVCRLCSVLRQAVCFYLTW